MDALKPPEHMSFDGGNVAEQWRRWERAFRTYMVAGELTKKTKATKAAILLHCAGPTAQDIYDTFQWAEDADKDDVDQILAKFKNYCEPRKYETYNRFVFQDRVQREGETIDQWVTDLRKKAASCSFPGTQEDIESFIRDRIVFGVCDTRLRERLMRNGDQTLASVIDACRAAEATSAQLQAMTAAARGATTAVNTIKNTRQQKGKSHGPAQVKDCEYCGRNHSPRKCPAYGKKCNNCGFTNHFVEVCRKPKAKGTTSASKTGRKVHIVKTEEEEEVLLIGALYIGALSDQWQAPVQIHHETVKFALDTGAQANVLPYSLYKKLTSKPLQKTNRVLAAFGNSKIRPAGTVKLECHTRGGQQQTLDFYVTHAATRMPILGQEACESLQLVKRIGSVSNSTLNREQLCAEYEDVFTGIGEYEREYHIELDDSTPPSIEPARRVPYARQEKLKQTLQKLEQQGIIASVDKPTNWVSNLVVVEKRDGSLRVCLDPKALNTAIRREQYCIPTPADVQARFSGATTFTVLDMRSAFWHVRLSEESSYLCTFNTPWGKKRFLRMPFGISSASEVLQKRNEETFGDIPNVHVIADDIIIATDEKSHDETLCKVLDRAREKNIRFSPDKLQYRIAGVHYMGNVVSRAGLTPDLEKVKAITEMPKPEEKKALQRLLGMVKYLSQYIPGESDMTKPLRDLLKDDVDWRWEPEHDRALEQVKQALSREPVLRFYDVAKPVQIQADASQSGLGACLLQEGQPVAYASRTMTSAEVNYAQIEKEMLAMTYACEKFHPYIYGKQVDVCTDHRPLEAIMKKPIAKAPPRLQRMMIRLQRYSLRVTYVPGKDLQLPDTLSRAFTDEKPSKEATEAADDMEVMVCTLATNLPVSASKLADIREATEEDPALQMLARTIKAGWPRYMKSCAQEIRQYWHQKEEIHSADGLLLLGERIIIPATLRQEMLQRIHEGHLGAEKCKARARSVMYWPAMSDDIDDIVARCDTCLKFRRNTQKQPLMPHPVPEHPWQTVGADIMTFKSRDYLVVVDYFSKYPEMALLENKTAATIILHMKAIYARQGIPEFLVCDNMPFASQEFKQFADNWGITVKTSSPEFPQSNGQSERMIQTLKQALRKADEENQDPYIALLRYRNTPVSGMDSSPAQLLQSRMLRDKLPITHNHLKPRLVSGALQQLKARQASQKYYHDRRAKDLPALNKGDVVRIRRGRTWETAIVTESSLPGLPRSYKVLQNGRELRRNRYHLRPGVAQQQKPPEEPPLEPPAPVATSEHVEQPPAQPQSAPTQDTATYTTRGRKVVAPKRYSDYVR